MTATIMKPSAEILEIARNKAAILFEGTQIRVGGGDYEKSYWVFRPKGGEDTYIGSMHDEPLPNFFKNRKVYEMVDNVTGKLIFSCQKLTK